MADTKLRIVLSVLCVVLAAPCCYGDVVVSYIGGAVTSSLQTSGDYAGLYKYEFDIEWDLPKGLSHVDIVLPECLQTDNIIFEFEEPAGYSTGEENPELDAINWLGEFEPRDPSIDLESELIKYEPIEIFDEPGKMGSGYFWFYSDIGPVYLNCLPVIAAKNGREPVYGEVIPEPATIFLLGLGSFFTLVCKKKNRTS